MIPDYRSALTAAGIRSSLKTHVLGRALHVHQEVESTNQVAMALAQAGAADGTTVVADAQTQGRGRLGRSWLSPPHSNIYLSVLLVRTLPRVILSWISLVTGVSVARALLALGVNARLKWPNDVLVYREGQERKIAGILVETVGDHPSDKPVVVVGIGLNTNIVEDDFPEHLRRTATSIHAEIGRMVDREQLIAALLLDLEKTYAKLQTDQAGVVAEFIRLCDTVGKRVRIDLVRDHHVTGFATGLAEDGALRLQQADGHILEIRAGDVVHLR